VTIIWIDSMRFANVLTDPSFASVSLLLHGNGANNSTSIIDSSPSPKTITAVGNAKISTAIADPFGNSTSGVLALDGSGDYLTAANNSSLNFDGGDFTIECWFYAAALPGSNQDGARVGNLAAYGGNFFGGNAQGYEFFVDFTNNTLTLGKPGSPNQTRCNFTFSLNTWYHVAYARAETTNRLFINGQSMTIAANTFSPVTSPTGVLRIGSFRFFSGGYNHDFNGYIDELRITKGVARYTSTFTPPTAPFPDS
jgi:hypothetical protein